MNPAAPGARHGHRGAGPGSHLLDALRGGLGDIDVAVLVDGHAARVADGPAARAAATGQRGGVPGPERAARRACRRARHDDDPAVTRVGDEEVARRIERDAARPVEDTRSEHGARTVRTVAAAAAAAPPARAGAPCRHDR